MWPSRLLLALALLSTPAAAAADEATGALLEGGGQVVIMRHAATAQAASDALGPDGCSSQRNLSDAGREDARRIGAAFRARGIVVKDVRASVWCRCMDTARLAFGTATNWPALDSFFRDRSREAGQTREVRELVNGHREGTLVLVTHQVNIIALTGLSPAEGEMLILTPRGDDFTVAGRLTPTNVD